MERGLKFQDFVIFAASMRAYNNFVYAKSIDTMTFLKSNQYTQITGESVTIF